MKRFLGILLAAAMLLSAICAFAEEEAHLTGLTAAEIVSRMHIGWNMGNTFDATGYNAPDIYSHETSWGNPVVDQALIQRVRDAGFNCIRIPISWFQHVSDDGTFTIDPAFMARVREVVDYAYELDMYVIINMHHENWLNTPTLDKDYETIGVQFAAMWKQIAHEFAAYDQHLIFESMNEPRMVGTSLEWNGNKAGYAAVNYLNQVFVDVIRTNPEGNNGERALMIPGYAASSSYTPLAAIELPTFNGVQAENIIISVHCYSPYDFCLSDKQTTFNPDNKAHTNSIDSVFSNLEKLFLENGIPVVMGETGATNTGNNHEDRARWAYYVGAKSVGYGIPILIWDNGNNQTSGGECHVWVRRAINAKLRSQRTPIPYPDVLEQLFAGAASVEPGSLRRSLAPEKSALNGTILWGNVNGVAVSASGITIASKAEWYTPSRTFAVVFTGAGTPSLTLEVNGEDAATVVAPDRVDNMGTQRVAWFSGSKLLNAVSDTALVKSLSVSAPDGGVTALELCYIGR